VNICKRCGKENQEHYKFCLGCGGELTSSAAPPASSGAQKTMMANVGGLGPLGGPPPGVGAATAPTPPGGVPALSGGPAPTGTPGLGVPAGLGGAPHSAPSAVTYPGSGANQAGPPPLASSGMPGPSGGAPFGGAPYGAPPSSPYSPPGGPAPGGPAKTVMAQAGGAPLPGAIPPPPGWGAPAGPPGFPPPSPAAYGQPQSPPPYQPPPGVAPYSPPGIPPGGPSPAPSSFGAPPSSTPGVPIAQAAFGGSQPAPSFGGPSQSLGGSQPLAPVAPAPGSGQVAVVSGGVRVCPNCGSEIPGSFQFCGACGTRLGTGAAVARTGTTGELASRVAPVAEPKPHGRLTLIRPDGSEGGQHELEEGENRIGRSHGALFENDGYLSPDHAEVIVNAAGAVIRDLTSLNGVFCKMTGEEELSATDVFRIGQELLRYDAIAPPQPLEDGTEIMGSPNPGYWGRLSVIIGKDIDGSAFPLFGDAVTIGRERGDINFPDDGYVSGVHARISQRDGKTFIVDLGSSNGTFIKLRGERVVQDGAFVLFGQQLFRVNLNVG